MAAVCVWLGGGMTLPLMLIVLPLIGGLISWLLQKNAAAQMTAVVFFGLINVFFCLALYLGGGVSVLLPASEYGLEGSFFSGGLSSVLPLFAAMVALLLACYFASFYRGKKHGGVFLLFFFTSIGFVNGALLSDNMHLMLVFWEGLLICMSVLLLLGNLNHPRAAIKLLWINGVTDLMLMLGVIITIRVSGMSEFSEISPLPVNGLGAVGCVLMLLGALGKAGAMPFHSWIPTAADDAQSPFLALFPAALGPMLGISLSYRIVTQLYDVQPGSPISTVVMILGCATLLFGMAMALIQQDIKRMLSYQAIGQVGFMILGVGSALPIGTAGALMLMLHSVLYQSGLFLTAGIVEHRAGTTDLRRIGTMNKSMPMITICFAIFALASSGFPGFSGFYSRQLIFDAALQTNVAYFIVALVGVVMAAVSFLKLGGTAFFGKSERLQEDKHSKNVPFGMQLTTIVFALLSLFAGLFHGVLQQSMLQPALDFSASVSGWPGNGLVLALFCAALALALLLFLYGRKKGGSALKSVDCFRMIPGVRQLYAAAEAGKLDPYLWLTAAVGGFARICMSIEHGVSWIYDKGVPRLIDGISSLLHRAVNGSLTRYLALAVGGLAIVGILFLVILL